MSYEGNCRLGDLFFSRREKGRDGLPTLSVTLNNGVVNRDDLDRKQETTLSADEHLLVKPGDIAYNMMRMWQGASGMVDKEGLVSPAYVVLKPKPTVDPAFASYLFKTKRMKYLFWAYSHGLTEDRLRLYFQDFARIPINVPSVSWQSKIAKILFTWDKAISITEKLIKNSKAQRIALIQEILTGKNRLHGFADDWRKVRLSDVADIIVSNVDKKSSLDEKPVRLCNYTDVYYNSYLNDAIDFMAATATKGQIQRFSLAKGDVLITKDSETADDIAISACVTENLQNVLCGYHLAILRPRPEELDSIFLNSLFSLPTTRYHFASHANGVTRFGLPIHAIEDAPIFIPSIHEQRKLASLIEAIDSEIRAQQLKLAILVREKSALMQQLLTGKRRALVDQPARSAA